MIKAVFFDNDGTLVDTEKFYSQALERFCEQEGLEYTEAFRMDCISRGFEAIFAETHGPENADAKIGEVLDFYQSLCRAQDPTMRGAIEVLKQLKSELDCIGVVTAALRPEFEVTHENTIIRTFIDFEITAEDVLKTKPHPEPYLLALEKSGLTPDECLVIEDTPRGIKSGNLAGLKTVAIPNSCTKTLDFSEADVQLESISALPDLINQINLKN